MAVVKINSVTFMRYSNKDGGSGGGRAGGELRTSDI